jgi:hypothetical protein
MNEIALIKQNLNGLRVRDCVETRLKGRLSVIIYTLFEIAGQTPSEHDANVIVREVGKDLQKKYANLTLDEVDYALNAGVRGEYGEYFGINVVSINKWLRAYYNSEERIEAQRSKIFPELALQQQSTLTDREILEIKLEAYDKALSLAKGGKYVKDTGNTVYNFLYERGEISFTDAENATFMQQAQTELAAEARIRAKEARTPRPVGDFIDKITDELVNVRFKRIALNEHLKRKMMDEF